MLTRLGCAPRASPRLRACLHCPWHGLPSVHHQCPSELRSPSLSSRPESDLTSATGDEEALATWERRPPSTMAPTSWLGTPNNSWAVGTASPPDRRTAKAGKDDSVEHRHSAARRKPAFEPEPCPGGAWASEGVDPHRPQGPSGLWGSTAFAPHPVRQPATLC